MTQIPNDIEKIRILPDENDPRFLGLRYVIGDIGLKLHSYSSDKVVEMSSDSELHPQVALLNELYDNQRDSDVTANQSLQYVDMARYAVKDESADSRASVVNKMLMGAWLTAYESTIGANHSNELTKRSLDARYAFSMTESMAKYTAGATSESIGEPAVRRNQERDIVLQCVVDELLLATSAEKTGPLTRAANLTALGRAQHDLATTKTRRTATKDAIEQLAIAKGLLQASEADLGKTTENMSPNQALNDRILKDAIEKLQDEVNYFLDAYVNELTTAPGLEVEHPPTHTTAIPQHAA